MIVDHDACDYEYHDDTYDYDYDMIMMITIRTVRLATPPSDKLLSLTSGINSNLTALLSLLQVYLLPII